MGRRSLIVAKFAEVLTGTEEERPTAAADRVQRSPSKPLPDALLEAGPVLQVFWLDESSRIAVMDPREYRRGASIAVRGIVQENDDETREEALDDLADEIEDAIEASRDLITLPGSPSPVALNVAFNRAAMETSVQGRKGLGAVLLVYDVAYDVERPSARGDLDEFLTGKTTIHHAGTPEIPEAIDPQDVVSREDEEEVP